MNSRRAFITTLAGATAFRAGLHALGWAVGATFTIEPRFPDGAQEGLGLSSTPRRSGW